MTATVNIILPTIRFLPVTRDIIYHLIGAVEDAEDIHLTIADGQEDDQKKEIILARAERLAKDGKFTYIGLKDPTQRVLLAAQLETEWVLPLSDDDPYSINLIRGAYDMSRTVSSDTMAITPYAYLYYLPTQFNLFRLQDIDEEQQGVRLLSLYRQAHLNGILTWSMIRRKPFLEWLEFLRTKTICPTYADQLLVSYLAMKGKIIASKEKTFYGKDDWDWYPQQRAIIKDSGSYPNTFLALFHEIFWISDLYTFLRSNGLEDAAVPSLTFRATALLVGCASAFEPRRRVLEIEKSCESEEAYSLVVNLASYAKALGNARVEEHVRFFMQVQSMGQTLMMEKKEEKSHDHTLMYKSSSDRDTSVAQPSNISDLEEKQLRESSRPVRSVLIVCTHFPPSVGGLETIAAQLGKSLIAKGYDVHVATERSEKREFKEYCGITIHSLDPVPLPEQRLPRAVRQLRELILSGRYDACILLADPRNWIFWSLEELELPEHTRIIAQPLINAEGFARWRDNRNFRTRLTQILKRAHSVVAISTGGAIVQYLTEEGIPYVYIPNAVERETGRDGFRARYGIPESVPLLLHIANLWRVKNHLGLMDALSTMDGDWRLVMIGHSSGDSQYEQQVRDAVRRDPRFILIPGLPRDEIAAALETADILLLASRGEVAPVTILEAMSHAKPWLATQECGGVHDNAGGLIVPIEQFPQTLSWLVQNSHVLQRLGRLGYEHWNQCFRWDAVIEAWDSLIKIGASSAAFAMPPCVSEDMHLIRNEILQDVHCSLAPAAPALASRSLIVSVIVPTYNRPDTLVDALRSILNQTYQDFEIIVVNDAGSDVENIVRFLDRDGKITYIRHGSNRDRAAARNTAIKVARGKYIAYLDDDDIYYPDHLETLVGYLQKTGLKVAYTDALRAHQEKQDGRYVVTKRDLPYSFDFDYDRILVHNFIPILCLIHEKGCLDVVGLFDESLTTHEDWDLLIRLSKRFQIPHIKKVTCEFVSRTDGSTTTSAKLPDFRRTMAIVLERHMASASERPHVRAAQERILHRLQGGSDGAHVVTQPIESQRIAALLQQADTHCKAGDLQGAKEILGQAIDILPDNPQLLVTLGNVVLRLGDVEGARREFVKATALCPDYAPAYADLAAVLMHLGRLAEAETSARRALELDSTNISALKVLAKICLGTERYQEAVQTYATILEHAPNDIETLILVGNCYAETGRFEQARGFYQRVLALDPSNAVAGDNLAEVNRLASTSDGTVTRPITQTASEDFTSVSIVIVTYNSASTIRACLDSILSETRPATHLIVVDNLSTDKTRSILREYQGRIATILNPDNIGFSAACNQGIRASGSEYVVLLNPDTVVTPGWSDRLIGYFGPGVGAVGPVSDYAAALQNIDRHLPDGTPSRMGLPEVTDLLSQANNGKARETKLLTGFCLMVPRKLLDEVGLLDEDLFLGNDDLDLSWRLRLRGYRLLVATDTFVHHEGQVSFKSEAQTKTSRLVQESTDRLYGKLEAHYGSGNVPSPMELWGIDWFRPTIACEPSGVNSEAPLTSHLSRLTSIIILTHNGLEHTKKCLVSIATHTSEPYELIIVDNDSTDGTLDFLRDYTAAHDNVRVVANRTNRGFAAGNNQGLALARGAYVLLLNNDTIVTEGWLRRMLAIFEAHPGVGIVGPMSNYVSGPQLVRNVSYKGPEELDVFATEWTNSHDGQSREATRVVGFCLLTRKEVIVRIGGLDEQFGSGNFEDDDFCIRAFQVGFRSRIALDVFIHHAGSQTFKIAKIDYRQSLMRNWEMFKRKWGIPAAALYEKGYRFPPQSASDVPLLVPLPDVNADYWGEVEGRWWQEPCGESGESQHTIIEEAQCSAVIVPNGHGLAPLWSSLVQHTNHQLTIAIVPSTGNGNGYASPQQPACPDGWQIRTADVPHVRLLNQLFQSGRDEPVILLSADLILTPGWLKRLLAVFDRDPRIGVVGPTSNYSPAPQQVKADYPGTGKALRQFALRRSHRYARQLADASTISPYCLVFKTAICRRIGPLRDDLDLSAALKDYCDRVTRGGYRVTVALDVYVHREAMRTESAKEFSPPIR